MKNLTFYVITVAMLMVVKPLYAGNVTIPNSFSAGTPAVAAEVNSNFGAVETEVDDNDARITTLENSAVTSGAGDSPLRVIRGSVNSAGGIVAGDGFTLENPVTGEYVITFDTSFTTTATLIASAWTIDGYIRTRLAGPGSVTIRILNSAGAQTDAGFHFIAIGGN